MLTWQQKLANWLKGNSNILNWLLVGVILLCILALVKFNNWQKSVLLAWLVSP